MSTRVNKHDNRWFHNLYLIIFNQEIAVDIILVFEEHVRCNPDIEPRLTSGGYEDKADIVTPINIILFIGGGKIWSLMEI